MLKIKVLVEPLEDCIQVANWLKVKKQSRQFSINMNEWESESPQRFLWNDNKDKKKMYETTIYP